MYKMRKAIVEPVFGREKGPVEPKTAQKALL